jgi:hypothetical protein
MALVRSPAASRAALAKYQSSLDPAFAKVVEVVGSYKNRVSNAVKASCISPLLTSILYTATGNLRAPKRAYKTKE